MNKAENLKEKINKRLNDHLLRKYLNALKMSDDKIHKPYNRIFFGSIKWLSIALIAIGLIGTFLIYLESNSVFNAIALWVILIWLAIFLRYFFWAVYHYNINYGYSDKDWENVKAAREKLKQGLPVEENELEAPQYNPYRSQTFGLPPGTVRGMIAFTLLFGAITILIVSMGMKEADLQNSLLRDQFEFFKTAFLMMIAFYFGDKSLKYLQKRWKDPNTKPDGGKEDDDNAQPDAANKSTIDEDDEEFISEDKSFDVTERTQRKDRNAKAGKLKTLLNNGLGLSTSLSGVLNDKEEIITEEFPQIKDNEHSKILCDEDIRKAIDTLKTEDDINLQYAALKAVIKVESGGRGHLSDGRAKILFEGHKFWYHLEKRGLNPEDYVDGNEDILYKKWTRDFYRGGAKEYLRYQRAYNIDPEAAVYATSWGLFQIMGENLKHNIKTRLNVPDGYSNYLDFVEKQHESEYYHLLDFLAFIKNKHVEGKPLISYISGNNENKFNWEKFAFGYNGRGYKINKYDTKLKSAYSSFKTNQQQDSQPTELKRIPIIDAGHGGIDDLGNYTTGNSKRYKFTGQRQKGFEIFEGVINRQIANRLIAKLEKENIPYYNLNSNDTSDMPWQERVKIADDLFSKNKGYYYLSIHSNSASKAIKGAGKKGHGFEIFTSTGTTTSDLYAKIAAGKYKAHFPKRTFRGVKETDYNVLKYTDCPAILVENLFFDNYEEATFLASEKGQEAIANCLLDVVKSII